MAPDMRPGLIWSFVVTLGRDLAAVWNKSSYSFLIFCFGLAMTVFVFGVTGILLLYYFPDMVMFAIIHLIEPALVFIICLAEVTGVVVVACSFYHVMEEAHPGYWGRYLGWIRIRTMPAKIHSWWNKLRGIAPTGQRPPGEDIEMRPPGEDIEMHRSFDETEAEMAKELPPLDLLAQDHRRD